MQNKKIKPQIHNKYRNYIYLCCCCDNKLVFNIYDLNFLYFIYDLLSIRHDKHKIVFCYSFPYVGLEITRSRIGKLGFKNSFNFYCKLLRR